MSTDWQSLTFIGERHEARLRVSGPDSADVVRNIVEGLADAEFHVPGHIVADIAPVGRATVDSDGSTILEIEALTVEE